MPHQRTSADPHPWVQRRTSSKLRWPKYVPAHNQPFRDELAMDREDWRTVYGFMSARRQLSVVDLKPSLREKLTAAMPQLLAYADHRCLQPRLMNRAHTVLDLSAGQKPAPEPATVAPADSLTALEQALQASIQAASGN